MHSQGQVVLKEYHQNCKHVHWSWVLVYSFQNLTTIIIPKPNKVLYDMLKSFRPIVLLNMLGKLIKNFIGDRLQFHIISNNFIHQSQLGGLQFKFTMDASITLTNFIHMSWIKNLLTSTLLILHNFSHHSTIVYSPSSLGKQGSTLMLSHFFPIIW